MGYRGRGTTLRWWRLQARQASHHEQFTQTTENRFVWSSKGFESAVAIGQPWSKLKPTLEMQLVAKKNTARSKKNKTAKFRGLRVNKDPKRPYAPQCPGT